MESAAGFFRRPGGIFPIEGDGQKGASGHRFCEADFGVSFGRRSDKDRENKKISCVCCQQGQ